MKLSILPVFILAVFAFSTFVTHRARRDQKITTPEARGVYLLLAAIFGWTLAATAMGMRNLHTSPWLLENIPLLWQSFVAVGMIMTAFTLSRTVRDALRKLADATPMRWLVSIQALRIGAIGSIMKVYSGEINSAFPLWAGIPDFFYGLSAVVVGWLLVRDAISPRALAAWGITGAAVILVPLFAFMPHWMNEPGFIFIFEFPMVLAPSVVVPILISLDLLLTWKAVRSLRTTFRLDPELNRATGTR